MRIRQRKGATLGLVAVILLFVIALGIGFYFLAKIVGGGREMQNACDAGAVNVAKQALILPRVPAPKEFEGLGVDRSGVPDGSNEINLLSYNRAAGQTLLVALNAQAIGPAATPLANQVTDDLHNLGLSLQKRLNGEHELMQYFDGIAGSNNVKMLGAKSTVNISETLTPGWLSQGSKADAKSNVYLNPAVISPLGVSFEEWTAGGKQITGSKGGWPQGGFNSAAGMRYMRAYDALNPGGLDPIVGAVVCPQDRPHLVSLSEFLKKVKAVSYAPPNSWKAQCQSRETSVTNATTGALACAIVGALDAEYEAAIPRGVVRIKNTDSAELTNGAPPLPYIDVNASNSIFNHELWVGPGGTGPVFYASGGGLFVDFANGGGAIFAQWAAYNNSRLLVGDKDRDDLGHDKKLDPNGADVTPRLSRAERRPPLRSNNPGPRQDQFATVAEYLSITGGFQGTCRWSDYDDIDQPVNRTCWNLADPWSVNLGREVTNNPSQGSPGFTNVEYMKGQAINALGQNIRTAKVGPLDKPSGMKLYKRGQGYNTPRFPVQFMRIGTPYDYLRQIAVNGGTAALGGSAALPAPSPFATFGATAAFAQSATPSSILDLLWQRCREIYPPVTRAEVITLISSPQALLPPGATLYIYQPAVGQPLVISRNAPPWAPDAATITPEGRFPPVSSTWDDQLDNYSINSKLGVGGNTRGDANTPDQAYTISYGENIWARDTVEWRPSAGARKFLGELVFRCETMHGEYFAKPN